MQKQDYERLIDDKIKDAKLELWESRFKYFMAFAGTIVLIFGLIIPFWTIDKAEDKVDKAIEEMRANFEKLAGTQLREPKIVGYFNGKKLDGQVLSFSIKQDSQHYIILNNEGSEVARDVAIKFYYTQKSGFSGYSQRNIETNEENGFDGFWPFYQKAQINPGDSQHIPFDVHYSQAIKPKQSFPLMMKVTYNRPEPTKTSFTILFKE